MRPRCDRVTEGSKHQISLTAQAALLTRNLLQLRHVQLLHKQIKQDVLQQLSVQKHEKRTSTCCSMLSGAGLRCDMLTGTQRERSHLSFDAMAE